MRKRNCNMKLTGVAAAMAGVGAMLSLPAFALKVYEEGDLNVTVDTTLSVGAAWRASDINYNNVGRYNAAAAQGVPNASNLSPIDTPLVPTGPSSDTFQRHNQGSGVQDNSDLLWKKGKPVSEVVKGSVDLQVEYQDYGAFVRGKYFYDQAIMKGDGGTTTPEFYPTTDSGNPAEPSQEAGHGGEILDAFVWGNWMVQDMPLNVRLGQQVINWGEGVLFPNGINTINPIDVNALLTPGAELKEALIPVKTLYTSLGLTDNLSLEAFYQFEFEETRAPDCGTFFNTIDLVGENCYGGYYAFGFESGQTNSLISLLGGLGGGVLGFSSPEDFNLARGADQMPDDGDEFGLAMRYYVDSISTEVGAYYIHYSSRLPILSGLTPTSYDDSALGDGYATAPLNFGYIGLISDRLSNAQYVVEYPEGIELFGVSFNTSMDLGLEGETAVSGEVSYRKNQPFQIEDSVLLSGLIGAPTQLCPQGTDSSCLSVFPDDGVQDFISGGIQDDFYQAEVAFIQFFDRALGADRWTVLLDVAYNYANIPDKDVLLMNSAYQVDNRPAWTALVNPANSGLVITDPSVRQINDALYNSGTGAKEYYPTKSSYGYKLRMSGEYSNVFAGVNLVPTISFGHDLKGVTPGPISNFLEDRKSLGLSVEANYLNLYKVEMGYTDFYGAEPYNQLNDRDFYSLSASMSF